VKRLLAVLLVLGAAVALPERIVAARAAVDSENIAVSRTLPALGQARVLAGGLTKATCSSDNGDVCTCGAGALCLSGPDGCACFRLPPPM
jgi:hypothetical protein